MTHALVAGVGNVFFGDDGFGVEVARRLGRSTWKALRSVDVGIHTIHLAYELLLPYQVCVIIDCVHRGGAPGTLYVMEPDLELTTQTASDAHSMTLLRVFSAVRDLGGTLPRMMVLGCEGGCTDPGMGLSVPCQRAVPAALELVHRLVASTKEASEENALPT
jgi:hydrogenase maturation protease